MATKRQASKRNTSTRTTRTVDGIVRVSRLNGREGEGFHSVEMQRESIERYCKAHGIRIARWFDESDSVSGGTTKRAGLQEAMKRALKGATDGIIVSAVDRFARNMSEGVAEIKRLQSEGATFIAVEQNIDTRSTNSEMCATSNLLLGFLFLIADWQREALKEKWGAIRARHVANGVNTQVPYGYTRKGGDGDDRRVLIPLEPEAMHVRAMFERRARGESWSHIAAEVNAAGALTTKARAWTPQRVRDVVSRRVYLGEITSGHDIANLEAHEALVSLELFERANVKRGRGVEARSAASDRALLTGLARCATCGGSMVYNVPSAALAKRGTKPRYRCRGHYGWGKCPAPVSVPAPTLDGAVVEAFHAQALAHLSGDASKATEGLSVALKRLERARAVLLSWTTDTANDALRVDHREEYEAGTKVRADEVAAARAAVEGERTALGFHADLPTDLGAAWEIATPAERRSWLAMWFPVIAVGKATRRTDDVRARVRMFTASDVELPTGMVLPAPTDGPERGRRMTTFRPIPIR